MSKQTRKPVKWVSSAKRDLDAMPDYVKDVFGHAIDLAQASFVVAKPPVKLDVAQDIKAGTGGAAKVLVLYDCEPDLGWDLLGWLRLSYSHICYKERAQYLSSYLNSLNVAHYITYDRNAFRRELRSGAYTSIWMLGALPDCGPHLLNEVREAVKQRLLDLLAPIYPQASSSEPGYSTEQGWPLRKDVLAQELLAEASRVDGVLLVNEVLLAQGNAANAGDSLILEPFARHWQVFRDGA